ncbi:MAG: general secretion pathway protein GspK [Candidatus Omnitrophica bacterium]|nr:general secretion pathway protein GspK [Candidatus Omnitrophota bacterium]
MKLPSNNKWRRSSILIIALWSICLLTTFAVILGSQVRQKLVLVKRLDDRDNARLIAEAGVKAACAELAKDEEVKYSCLNQKWSNNPDVFRDVAVGNGKFRVSYETDSGETRFGAADEESKININRANAQQMARLFNLLGLEDLDSQDLAESIVDWRDADNALSGPGGAEDSYYRTLPVPYEAKDALFQTIDELLLVKGVNENNFPKIRKYITIYGNGAVNVNTAGKFVLMALGLSENVAERIIAYRNGKDNLAATADDNFFENVSELATKINEAGNLSQAEQAQINNVTSESSITTKSVNFMVRSSATLGNSKFSHEVIAVINRKGRILYWNES